MIRINDHDNILLMKKLSNDGRTNLSKWFTKIIDEFCEDKAIKEKTSFNEIKSRFHDDFHEICFCIVPTLLFKFLINEGVAYIAEPRPLLDIPCYIE